MLNREAVEIGVDLRNTLTPKQFLSLVTIEDSDMVVKFVGYIIQIKSNRIAKLSEEQQNELIDGILKIKDMKILYYLMERYKELQEQILFVIDPSFTIEDIDFIISKMNEE